MLGTGFTVDLFCSRQDEGADPVASWPLRVPICDQPADYQGELVNAGSHTKGICAVFTVLVWRNIAPTCRLHMHLHSVNCIPAGNKVMLHET